MPPDSSGPTHSASKSFGENEIDRLFTLQRHAFFANTPSDYRARIDNLNRIIRLIEVHEDRIINAVNADFGNRARIETAVSEILVTIAAAKHAKRHLKHWMHKRRVATPLYMKPAKCRLLPQPLGVVGIIAPWNYPVQLALSPAIAALAAGNRTMIKPSELTPRTGEILKEIIAEAFDESTLAVVTGGVETGQAFASTPFDHLLFTGSTAVGMRVAQAAAKNLTPVTLELGGKSPTIIDDSADIESAARSIAFGKLFNAGQTCVAPDYILAPHSKLDRVVDAIANAARKFYPEIDTTTDYSSIISDRHFARLKALVDEARDAGAKIVEAGSANALHPQRKMPLTMVIDPPTTLGIMSEEIFGPILPVIGYSSRQEAISYVNNHDRPLALYWFGEDKTARDQVLERTISGGVTVNDTMMHVAQENLPFGGVGKSGIGAYHGEAGFETFSHMKSVFYQSRFASTGALQPPYTSKTDKFLSFVKKII